MKDYAWRLADRYSNHEKHMSHRDGVEREVEGHGEDWSWNVRSTEGVYVAKDGKAYSLDDAMVKADRAADAVRVVADDRFARLSSELVNRAYTHIHRGRRNPSLQDGIASIASSDAPEHVKADAIARFRRLSRSRKGLG